MKTRMPRELLKRVVAYTWVVVGVAVLQLIWVFASRHLQNRKAEADREAAIARKYQPYAGLSTAVRIVQFYATPGVVPKGERTLICYGVDNASSVQIEPPVETLRPAQARCFWANPDRTTTYRLHATGADGTKAAQSLTVNVVPK
jgi:hypothetical protein